jgi:uncharacterized RDD family membrane protein YckC
MPGDPGAAFDTTQRGHDSPSGDRTRASDRWLGTTVDHFEITKVLGRGGMGQVYKAKDRSLDRFVAIKVVPDDLVGDPALEVRFVREARAQAQLNSPNVVHIYFIGHLPAPTGATGALYFAMELVDGEPLDAMLERGEKLDPEEARRLMLHVARGLRDAHRAGIIHRDIKPANLLRDRIGWLKIADFGIAKPLKRQDETEKSITAAGIAVGTPLYMAPEQARCEQIDHRADMYALGCTFYHLMAGESPFQGKTPVAIIAGHLSVSAKPIRGHVPSIALPLAAVVRRLMEKDKADRYASYDELIAALETAQAEPDTHAGFAVRGAAVLMDCVIASALVALLRWPGLLLMFVYVTIGHGLYGQTLPKALMRIAVQRVGGGRLGIFRAAVRSVMAMWMPLMLVAMTLATKGRGNLVALLDRMAAVSEFKTLVVTLVIGNFFLTALWMAGLVLAAFHPRKRALHDLVVDSEVVYRLPTPAVERGR